MNFAVIGCGRIGIKRADALSSGARLVGCFDLNAGASEEFARKFNTVAFASISELLDQSEAEAVIIATRHDSLAEIATLVLNSKKHVLIEKPGALSKRELESIAVLANSKNLRVHIGYNHRYHPSIIRAFEIYANKEIGDLMFMRARYGHGGRLGYENEWRAQKSLSGGGELIDQGSHLIDLAIGLFGKLSVDYAATPTYFWNTTVEDNAFVSLINSDGGIAFLHASCTEWKNMFSMEVYGRLGKIEISGLGMSYGVETLRLHKMLPQMGPPISQEWEYLEPDSSWQLEIEDFIKDIRTGSRSSDNINSSIEVLGLVEQIYQRTGK
jgi:predicted dehydrogenase